MKSQVEELGLKLEEKVDRGVEELGLDLEEAKHLWVEEPRPEIGGREEARRSILAADLTRAHGRTLPRKAAITGSRRSREKAGGRVEEESRAKRRSGVSREKAMTFKVFYLAVGPIFRLTLCNFS